MRAALLALCVSGLLVCSAGPSWASHFRYGQISWTRVSGNTVEFKVRSGWPCHVVDVEQTRLAFGDGQLSPIPQVDVNTVQIEAGQYCTGSCWAVYEFTTTHTYATEGPYTVSFDVNCQLPTQNVGGCPLGLLKAVVDLRDGNTGSPLTTIDPLILLESLPGHVIPIPITEPDGDAITCRFATPAESNIPAVATYPSAPLTLSGCVLNWDTSAGANLETWTVQVIIEETHAGNVSTTPVHFLIQICDGERPECTTTAQAVEIVDIGQTYNWSFQGTDADGDPLTVFFDAPGLPGTLTPPSGSVGASPMNVDLQVTPTVAEKGATFPVAVSFDDGMGWRGNCHCRIKVRECVSAPFDLVSWYPLDETSGPAKDVVSGIDASWGGPVYAAGAPIPTPSGIVDGAYTFGQTGLSGAAGIRAPKVPLHDFGTTGDFSIDAWVRPVGDGNSGSGLLPIVWKQGGYFLLLHEVASNDWRLAFDSGDLNLHIFLTPEVIANASGKVEFDEWSHVAVTVRRQPPLGTLYVNAQPAGTFDPSVLFNTDYTSPHPLRIGYSTTVSHFPIWFDGDIDEVEIFSRQLEQSDIEDLVQWVQFPADTLPLGKCKERCHLPNVTAYGKDDAGVTVPLTICSVLPGTQQYEVTVTGLTGTGGPAGVGCNVDGPLPADITISPPNPISVPFGCTTVDIEIDRPAGLTVPDVTACFKVNVKNLGTGESFECASTLKEAGELSPQGGGVPPGEVVGFPGQAQFQLRAEYEPEKVIYRVRALDALGRLDTDALELDGLAAGGMVLDTLHIPQGDSTTISVQYEFQHHHPLGFFDIVLETDRTGDGAWEAIASRGVRSLPDLSSLVGVPAPPSSPATSAGLSALPNPFSEETTLRFTLERSRMVRVEVYDITGHRVRTLLSSSLFQGPHVVSWDGRSDDGRTLPNGTYFIRLTTSAGAETGKVVFIR